MGRVAEKRFRLRLCGQCAHGLLLAASLALLAGCRDKGGQTQEVAGTVSFHGSALSTGAVVFYPEKGRPLDPAAIGADGVYRLQAPAGAYRVAVIALPTLQGGAGEDQKPPEQMSDSARSLIPEFYGRPQTSGLQITVEADKPNKIDLALR